MGGRGRGCDTALVLAARDGDVGALNLLLSASQPDIRRYARRQCRNTSDVEDAVQETLFLLYRRIATLRLIDSFSYWLFRIVDRVCLKLGRQMLGIASELDQIENDLRFATIADPELRLDLATAIESLPVAYRDVVVLRDIEECTINEIAEALSITRAAAKARLHRARRLVREYFQQ